MNGERIPDRRASYVVCPERVYFVTTITWRNEWVGNYGSNESGIRDMTHHYDGRHYETAKDAHEAIPFELCQHDIWPIERGHATVIDLLKRGFEPKAVYWEIDRQRRRDDD